MTLMTMMTMMTMMAMMTMMTVRFYYPGGVWTRTSPLSKRMSVGMTTKPNWLTARQERVDTGKARLVTFEI